MNKKPAGLTTDGFSLMKNCLLSLHVILGLEPRIYDVNKIKRLQMLGTSPSMTKAAPCPQLRGFKFSGSYSGL